MNTYLPAAYDERITRLALGIEPVDAQRGTRIAGPLVVTFDESPRPLHKWRTFPNGLLLDDVLPRMTRHGSGRYARIFARGTPIDIAVRLSDRSRRYVARRLRLSVPAESVDAAAAFRTVRIHLHPGANAELSTATSAIRGRIVHTGLPVRWCRVRAEETASGQLFGFTHGDDRGEFVLPLAPPADHVGMAADPLVVRLVLGVPPTPVPPPTDPLVPLVDPLWDLVEEASALPLAPPDPDGGDIGNGRLFPAGFTTIAFVGPFAVPAGQVSSAVLSVP
jgi:hypothetical protein